MMYFSELLLVLVALPFAVFSETIRECLKERDYSGDIVFKGDVKYGAANFQYNLRKLRYPRGYIVVNSTEDVRTSLKCLQKLKLTFRTKCGGHSYEKYSFGDNDSFVVDLSRLNKVQFNRESNIAIVGAGIQAFPLSKRLWEMGKLGLPVGGCPTVGISGFTLGGGFGPMSRKVGLMSDNVVAMEVITGDGKLRLVNKTKNSDLFWALRGGGGGNFGIVTKFYLKPFDASSMIITSTLKYPLNDFPVVFEQWLKWTKTDPKATIDSIIYYKIFGPEILAVKFVIYSIDFDETLEDLKTIKHFFDEVDSSQNMKVQPFFASLYPGYNSGKPSLVYEKHKSFFVTKYLNNLEIYRFHEQLKEHSYVSFLIQLCGGAVNAKSSTETAFCHRDTLFELDYGFTVSPTNQTQLESAINTGKTFEPKLKQFSKSIQFMSDRQAYINVIDGDEQNALQKYYCNNLEELKNVKRRYDPKDVFHFPLSIPLL